MTTKFFLAINGEAEVHVHTERRDEHGHFVRDEKPVVIRSDGREWYEGYLPHGARLVLSEHPLRKVDPPA